MKKKVILLPLIMMALASCGGNNPSNSQEPKPSTSDSTSTSISAKPSTSTSTKPSESASTKPSESTSTSTGGTSTVTPSKEYGIVDTPVAGTAYKFGFKQTAKNAVYYMKGEMSGYYIASTTNVAEAADMYVEEAEGGFHLYFMSGTAKKYIQAETKGTYLNAVIKDSATGVWKYKAEWKTLIWSLTNKDVFLGTYGDYVTFGVSSVDKAPTSYVSHFYAEGAKGEEPVIEAEKVAVTGVTADATLEVEQGKTKKITASVTPADATEKGLTFKSNDETKATVDANGVVTGVALGETTITVASKENPSFTATVAVTVKEASPSDPSKFETATYTINKALPEGLTYINSAGKDPEFYGNGSLKIRFEEIGVSAAISTFTGSLNVTISLTLNPNTKTSAASEHTFTVTALNAEGKEAGVAYFDSVTAGENTVKIDVTNATTLKVVMTGYPTDGTTYYNVGLGSLVLAQA